MENVFASWLNNILNEKGWSQYELAQRAGLARGTISNIMTGKRAVGTDTCRAIASATNMPIETVYRKAGLLPERESSDDLLVRVITNIAEKLDERGQEEVKRYAEYQLQIQEKQQRYNVHKNGNQQAEATP